MPGLSNRSPKPALACRLVRWYGRGIAGLAAFVLLLIAWPSSAPLYRFEVVVQSHPAGNATLSPEDVTTWLLSDEVLQAVLINVGNASQREGLLTASGSNLSELRQRLQVTPLSSSDEPPRIAITCLANRAHEARALAHEMAWQLAENFAPQQRELARSELADDLAQAQEQLRISREQEEHWRVELERQRHAQLALAMTHGRSEGTPTSPAPTHREVNPYWLEVQRELETLQSHKVELLGVVTPKHPEIEGLSRRIAKVEAQLRKTPKHLPSSGPANAAPLKETAPKTHSSGGGRQVLLEWHRPTQIASTTIAVQQYEEGSDFPAQPLPGLDPLLTLAAKIDEAAHHLALASRQRAAFEDKTARIQRQMANPAPASVHDWMREPVRRVNKHGGSPSGPQFWSALAAAWGVSALVMLLQKRDRSAQPIQTCDQLQAALLLPVLSEVPLESSGTPEKQHAPILSLPAVLRLLSRCSEAFLAGVLLTCLYAGWLDPLLAHEFTCDPFGALIETAQRVL